MARGPFIAVLGFAFAASVASSANAATTWDYYLYTGATHPITVLLKGFTEEVKKRTNGELIINVRPAGELPFRATEVVKVVGEGQTQMGSASPGFVGATTPIATVGNHVGLIRTYDDMEKVWPTIEKYTSKHFEQAGAKILFHWSWPTQHVFGTAAAQPIHTLEDFKGRKLRTVAPEEAVMLKRLGAASISLTTPEVPVALDRGVVHGLISAAFNVVGSNWQDQLKWVWVSELHMGGPNYELVNIKAYNALPANVRATLDQVAKEWTGKMNQTIGAQDANDLKALGEKYKLQLVKARPEDLAKLHDVMQDYWDAWAKEQGPDGVAMMKEIRSQLGR
jgi:TRAP-type C4-dicarboxylate transport system substrate-binding protein